MCVFECLLCTHLLCYCKQNDMAQYYFPSTISRPHACVFCCRCWMHQLHGCCKCISSVNHISLNLEDGEQEMEGGGGGGGYKVATSHSQLLVKKIIIIIKNQKSLNAVVCTGKPLFAEFQNTFGTTVFFFPPVCIQAASSHAAVSMAISICVRNSLTLSRRSSM